MQNLFLTNKPLKRAINNIHCQRIRSIIFSLLIMTPIETIQFTKKVKKYIYIKILNRRINV